MRDWVFMGVAALAGCSEPAEPGWEPLPGLARNAIFDLQLDPAGHPVVANQYELWRYSDTRQAWGQLGLDGRDGQYLAAPFVVAPGGTVYAAESVSVSVGPRMFVLPPGGGTWQVMDVGLPVGARVATVLADRAGLVYAFSTLGSYRMAEGGTRWEPFDTTDRGACSHVIGDDNTIYVSCASGVEKLATGGSAFEPLPTIRQIHAVHHDGSLEVTMAAGGNGRLAPGATTPVPYPSLLPEGELEIYEYVPWDDAFQAPLPVPFAVDQDDNVYAIGKARYQDLMQVFRLAPGDDTWTGLGPDHSAIGRHFVVSPAGAIYSFATMTDVINPEAAYRRRAP